MAHHIPLQSYKQRDFPTNFMAAKVNRNLVEIILGHGCLEVNKVAAKVVIFDPVGLCLAPHGFDSASYKI